MKIVRPETYETLLERMRDGADRRAVLKTGAGLAIGVAGLAAGSGLGSAQDESTPAAEGTPEVCVLTPELTEGPFYLNDNLIRNDITEGRPGVPLLLRIVVVDPETCATLENVAVDIWHCDALGYYSGVSAGSPRNGDPEPDDLDSIANDNFLRGVQFTDASGGAEFTTIYPGWYQGRAIHIHMKVHTGGQIDDGSGEPGDETYGDVQTAHTGQLFFDETMNDLVFALPPYSDRISTRLANADDSILGRYAEEPGFLIDLKLVDEDDVSAGVMGTITVGIEPA